MEDNENCNERNKKIDKKNCSKLDYIYQKLNPPYLSEDQQIAQPLRNLETSLIKVTGDEEFVKGLIEKLGQGSYIYRGFVTDLIRRQRISYENYDSEELLRDTEAFVEDVRDLRCEGEYATEIRRVKDDFERGVRLAQQSEI